MDTSINTKGKSDEYIPYIYFFGFVCLELVGRGAGGLGYKV